MNEETTTTSSVKTLADNIEAYLIEIKEGRDNLPNTDIITWLTIFDTTFTALIGAGVAVGLMTRNAWLFAGAAVLLLLTGRGRGRQTRAYYLAGMGDGTLAVGGALLRMLRGIEKH